jgi:hypothetical protein
LAAGRRPPRSPNTGVVQSRSRSDGRTPSAPERQNGVGSHFASCRTSPTGSGQHSNVQVAAMAVVMNPLQTLGFSLDETARWPSGGRVDPTPTAEMRGRCAVGVRTSRRPAARPPLLGRPTSAPASCRLARPTFGRGKRLCICGPAGLPCFDGGVVPPAVLRNGPIASAASVPPAVLRNGPIASAASVPPALVRRTTMRPLRRRTSLAVRLCNRAPLAVRLCRSSVAAVRLRRGRRASVRRMTTDAACACPTDPYAFIAQSSVVVGPPQRSRAAGRSADLECQLVHGRRQPGLVHV